MQRLAGSSRLSTLSMWTILSLWGAASCVCGGCSDARGPVPTTVAETAAPRDVVRDEAPPLAPDASLPAEDVPPMTDDAPVLPEDRPAVAPHDAKVVRTEEQWKALLDADAYYVLRQKGTEPPFRNKYDEHFEAGEYACAACGQVLFASDTKFNSGCGWPAFYAAKAGDRVVLTPDLSHGMVRTEVTCARCDSHLGHVFDDAPQTPTGQRFCINSISLKFIPAVEQP